MTSREATTGAVVPSTLPPPQGTSHNWREDNLFLAACNVMPSSGITSYAYVPKANPEDGSDVTSFHPGQAYWGSPSSTDPRVHVPEILDRIRPSLTYKETARNAQRGKTGVVAPFKRDASNNLVLENWPKNGNRAKALREYPILPNQISTYVEGWRLEAWIRLDPRIQRNDILARMKDNERTPAPNALQMRTLRWRELNECISFRDSSKGSDQVSHDSRERVWKGIPAAQRNANTLSSTRPRPNFDAFHGGGKARAKGGKRKRTIKNDECDEVDNETTEKNSEQASQSQQRNATPTLARGHVLGVGINRNITNTSLAGIAFGVQTNNVQNRKSGVVEPVGRATNNDDESPAKRRKYQHLANQALTELALVDQALMNPASTDSALTDPFAADSTLTVPDVVDSNLTDSFSAYSALTDQAVVNQNMTGSALTGSTLTEPALTDHFSADLALIDPGLIDPACIDPALIDPSLVDLGLIDPALTHPSFIDPALVNPVLAEAAFMDPGLTDPVLTDPALIDPVLFSDTGPLDDQTKKYLAPLPHKELNSKKRVPKTRSKKANKPSSNVAEVSDFKANSKLKNPIAKSLKRLASSSEEAEPTAKNIKRRRKNVNYETAAVGNSQYMKEQTSAEQNGSAPNLSCMETQEQNNTAEYSGDNFINFDDEAWKPYWTDDYFAYP